MPPFAHNPTTCLSIVSAGIKERLQKEWLLRGAIISDDEKLASDLAGPGYHLKANTNQLVIES